MSICIFPGTFNPIHNGHIAMAKFALEKYNFEKIIFIPSYIPPHKEINRELADHRFEMVKLAIQNYNQFEVSDIEYRMESKSYSLITVKKLIEQYNLKNRLNFIIGTDAFAQIDSWYKSEELKELVHFLVFPRRNSTINVTSGWSYELTGMDYIDISSTEIRDGEILKLDKKVEVYIKDHGLYKI